jgi:serine/threonine protein kinase
LSSREPGTVLDGKYEIVRRLGSGGMGEVHLVRHVHLQELRVIKILRQDLAADPSAQARFLREARLATQIKHPNVAILYDFARLPEGSFYMVWEYIEGQDVGDHIRKSGPFPVPVAIQLGIQALRGLEAIHQIGVIHRDLSPDNLMITEDRRGQIRMKIIDLGLAKTLGADGARGPGPNPNLEITQVGMFMGKLQYCSPEQAGTVSGETLDRRSDIYSFGLVLYEMLSGLPPFDSENPHGFVFKRLSEDPLPLVGRNPEMEIPVELDRVVRRALERDREARYPDAISFITALEKVGRSLEKIETQEIPLLPALAAAPARPAGQEARRRSSSELSPEERKELLAQIDRAARRAQESTQVLGKAELALSAGRLDEAKEIVRQVEAVAPRAQGLEQIRARIREAEEKAEQRQRVAETEQVLTGYLERRQVALSRLALDTLLELQPAHPKRAEYEAAIAQLAREAEQEKRADRALGLGREALAAGDFRTARRELETIAKNDASGQRAAAFRVEIETAERGQRQGSEVEEHRRRLEEHLAQRRVADAESEYRELANLEVTRVTLDNYRVRLDEVRSQSEQKERVVEFERRYRILLDHQDWFGAREVAQEFEQKIPGHPKVAAMVDEIERLESAHRRQEAVEQGVRQIEAFVAQGEEQKAELALKVLLQMDPDNRHRRRLERQIKGMRKK